MSVCADRQATCGQSQGSSHSARGFESSILQERRGMCVCCMLFPGSVVKAVDSDPVNHVIAESLDASQRTLSHNCSGVSDTVQL